MRIRKSTCIESNETHCYTEKFNVVLSLYRVLVVTLYFSEGFSEVAAALRSDYGLLLGIGIQLVVSCTTIEAQIIFKMLLVLITSQLGR